MDWTFTTAPIAKLALQLSEGFKKNCLLEQIYGKVVAITCANNEKRHTRGLIDSTYQGVKRYSRRRSSFCWFFQKYFLPRVKSENYNIEIDGRNFYDQPINDLIKR